MSTSRQLTNQFLSKQSLADGARVAGAGLSTLLATWLHTKDFRMQVGLLGFEVPSIVMALSLDSFIKSQLLPESHANEDYSKTFEKYAKLTYRGYNLATALLVFGDYVTNPEAAAIEYLPDIAIHLFDAIAPDRYNKLALGLHTGRGFQAGYAYWTGNSSIPEVANLVDAGFNHALSLFYRAKNMVSEMDSDLKLEDSAPHSQR